MATSWAKCPDLFLYTKGNDVYLWRCKDETTWMPMITANFDDLGKVTDYLDLIGGKDSILEWEKSSYIDLIAYISSRRLLVNSRGLVIAELHEFGQDGKMEENVLPFFIRSLDVLSLKPFGLRDRNIPRRTVRYLETEGKAAPVEEDSTTSTDQLDDGKRRGDLEKEVAELKDANKTLKSDKEAAGKQVTELKEANKTLKSDKEAAEKQVTELKEANKTLKSDKEAADKQVTELKETNKSDKEAAETQVTKLKENNKKLKNDKEAAEKQVTDLKDRNKSLVADVAAQKKVAEKAKQERDQAKRDKEAAERKAADLQTQIDSLVINEKKEVWMNQFSDQLGYWNTFDCLRNEIFHINLSSRQNFFTVDDDLTTNVQASYIHFGFLADANNVSIDVPIGTSGCFGYKAVRLNDLNPNKEKARFSIFEWYRGTCNGEMYAIKERFPSTPRPQPPGDSSKLSAEEVRSLNLLGR